MKSPDLKQLRAEMLALLSDPRVEEIWDHLADTLGHKEAGRSAGDLRKAFMYGLTHANLFSLTKEMGEFAEAQALASDAEAVSSESLPCPHGVLFFEEPVTAYRAVGDGREVRIPMTGLLWTEVNTTSGTSGVAIYALAEDVYMPSLAAVLATGHGLTGKASDQSVFFKVAQACWKAIGRRQQAPNDLEMRTATLPDGHRITIACKPGLSQDEVDLLAAQVWTEMPDA